MNQMIVVGCPYCRWTVRYEEARLRREGLLACQSCRALLSAEKAEAAGREIEAQNRGREPLARLVPAWPWAADEDPDELFRGAHDDVRLV